MIFAPHLRIQSKNSLSVLQITQNKSNRRQNLECTCKTAEFKNYIPNSICPNFASDHRISILNKNDEMPPKPIGEKK